MLLRGRDETTHILTQRLISSHMSCLLLYTIILSTRVQSPNTDVGRTKEFIADVTGTDVRLPAGVGSAEIKFMAGVTGAEGELLGGVGGT